MRLRFGLALAVALGTLMPVAAFGQGQGPPGPPPQAPPGVTMSPREYHGPQNGDRVPLDAVPGLTPQMRQQIVATVAQATGGALGAASVPGQPMTARRYQLPAGPTPNAPTPPRRGETPLRLLRASEAAPAPAPEAAPDAQFAGWCYIGGFAWKTAQTSGQTYGFQSCQGAVSQTLDVQLFRCYFDWGGTCLIPAVVYEIESGYTGTDGLIWVPRTGGSATFYAWPLGFKYYMHIYGQAWSAGGGYASDWVDTPLMQF